MTKVIYSRKVYFLRFTRQRIAFFLFFLAFLFSGAVYAMSDRQEIEIGQQVAAEVEHRFGVWHDSHWEPVLRSIGNDLIKHTTRPLPYTFKLVNMKEANAFALPGGFVYVTRGLLSILNHEGELAAVLSHEVSHVELKHFQKMVDRDNTINLISMVAMILTKGAARPFLNAANLLDTFVFQPKYSRDQETQADFNGIKLMIESGRDPYDMIGLFEAFQKKEKNHGFLPLWMHDHPDFPSRILAVQSEIAKIPAIPPRTAGGVLIHGEVLPDRIGTPANAIGVNSEASGDLRIQWAGETVGISQIEYEGKDSQGEVILRSLATSRPFSAVLHPTGPVTSVDAVLTYADGSKATLTFPVVLSSP